MEVGSVRKSKANASSPPSDPKRISPGAYFATSYTSFIGISFSTGHKIR